MAVRITRVYTRTGDDGATGLVGGERVAKDSARIEAYGSLDELNSVLGAALAELSPPAQAEEGAGPASDAASAGAALASIRDEILWVQQKLFDLGAYLATPPDRLAAGRTAVDDADVRRLEEAMDRWNESLEALSSFVLPGGGRAGAALHVARTVCRRVERRVLSLHRQSPLAAVALAFLNRLSDLLFVAARRAAKALGCPETLWVPGQGGEGGNGGNGGKV